MPRFYHAPNSRSTSILALVHELGDPEDLEIVQVGIPRQDGSGGRDPRNPHPEGKVPVIVDGDELIRERGAIIVWLTERYASDLAPLAGQKNRGAFLAWLFWYQGVFEPVVIFDHIRLDDPLIAASFRDVPTAVAQVQDALTGRDYLLGDRYSAADLLVSGAFAYFRPLIPDTGPIGPWVERCQGREATRRAWAEDAAASGEAA